MNNIRKTMAVGILIFATGIAIAQTDDEELRIAALEALISAPPERALPIVQRVLNGNDSEEVKMRAFFVLSQIDLPEAQAVLADAARNNSGEMQLEAVRMIGISGEPAAIEALADVYAAGDMDVKEAVLEAWMIAGNGDAVFQVASTTDDPDEFEAAVEMLGVMGETGRLRELRNRTEMSDVLIDAYAIAGDVESLRTLAADASDPDAQEDAISALGIIGGPEVNTTLVEIYRNAQSKNVREAALEGMMISGYDEGVLQLFRETERPEEKRELLEMLVIMDSDAVWDLIDATLDNQ